MQPKLIMLSDVMDRHGPPSFWFGVPLTSSGVFLYIKVRFIHSTRIRYC